MRSRSSPSSPSWQPRQGHSSLLVYTPDRATGSPPRPSIPKRGRRARHVSVSLQSTTRSSVSQMFELLDESPMLHEGSYVIVEYPLKELRNIPDTLGPLVKVRDRRYGRTFLAIWGPRELLE